MPDFRDVIFRITKALAQVSFEAQLLEVARDLLKYAWDNERTGRFDFDRWQVACRLLLGPKGEADREGRQLDALIKRIEAIEAMRRG